MHQIHAISSLTKYEQLVLYKIINGLQVKFMSSKQN